jgi:hypothetical protein
MIFKPPMNADKQADGFFDDWMNGFLGGQSAASFPIHPSIHSSTNPFFLA